MSLINQEDYNVPRAGMGIYEYFPNIERYILT